MMKKPKFGIVVAVTQSPMAKAYKKAVGAKKPSPEDSDPGMLKLPKTPSKGKPKDKGMLPPKSGKPSKYKTRTDKKM
jgi:hypothetical protein